MPQKEQALIIDIDENKNFKIEINYFSELKQIRLDLISYTNSKQLFVKNFTKNLSITSKKNLISIDKLPFSYKLKDINREVSLFYLDKEYLVFKFENNQINILKKFRKLAVFETRLIGRYLGDYSPLVIDNTPSLYTDLHTHLSGQVTAEALIQIGLNHNILYPTSFFDQQNVEYNKNNLQLINKKKFLPTAHLNNNLDYESAIPFKDLSIEALEILKNSLFLSPETQSTFEDIENCYKLREPFTKNIDLLEDIFEAIAKDYAENNVKYVELSSNAIIDPIWLNKIENILPIIEKNYGVIFRFLIGIPRNLSKADLRERINKIKLIYQNPYIIGIDLLGYEINKTSHLETKLALLAEYIKHDRDEFIYRIHAGENSKNPNNVKEALLFAIEHKVKMRIGHALYGIDEETLELASKLSRKNLLVIEFNPDSNLASNNIDFPKDLSIKKFINAGIKCVLSSDGGGLYQTSSKQTAIAGKICGLQEEDFNFIHDVEKEYLQQEFLLSTNLPNPQVDNNSDPTPNIIADINHLIINKVPIFIAGATGSSWLEISHQKKKFVKKLLKKLVYSLDPNKVFFVTGRSKDKGIGIELGKIITLYNFEHNKNFLFISLISEASEASASKPKGISYITDFSIPLVYLPSEIISYIKSQEGIAIFIGGKSFTRDFIVEANKQNIKYALMENVSGAANDKSLIYIDKKFANYEELIKIIDISNIRI